MCKREKAMEKLRRLRHGHIPRPDRTVGLLKAFENMVGQELHSLNAAYGFGKGNRI